MNEGMDIHSTLWYHAGMPRERVERVNRHYALRLSVAQELERLAFESGESETATLEALITYCGTFKPQVTTITTTDGRVVDQYIDGRLAPKTLKIPAGVIARDTPDGIILETDPEAEQAARQARTQRKADRKTRKGRTDAETIAFGKGADDRLNTRPQRADYAEKAYQDGYTAADELIKSTEAKQQRKAKPFQSYPKPGSKNK